MFFIVEVMDCVEYFQSVIVLNFVKIGLIWTLDLLNCKEFVLGQVSQKGEAYACKIIIQQQGHTTEMI